MNGRMRWLMISCLALSIIGAVLSTPAIFGALRDAFYVNPKTFIFILQLFIVVDIPVNILIGSCLLWQANRNGSRDWIMAGLAYCFLLEGVGRIFELFSQRDRVPVQYSSFFVWTFWTARTLDSLPTVCFFVYLLYLIFRRKVDND